MWFGSQRRWVVLGLALASGCAVPMDAGDDAPPQELEATLPDIHQHVFLEACALSGCHTGDKPAGELDLTTLESARDGLVEMPVVNAVAAENRWLRVKPGEPELSFLMRKLTGPGIGEGAPMPPGENELTDYYIDLIATWIEEGAP